MFMFLNLIAFCHIAKQIPLSCEILAVFYRCGVSSQMNPEAFIELQLDFI